MSVMVDESRRRKESIVRSIFAALPPHVPLF